jgi:hypothetical protein
MEEDADRIFDVKTKDKRVLNKLFSKWFLSFTHS